MLRGVTFGAPIGPSSVESAPRSNPQRTLPVLGYCDNSGVAPCLARHTNIHEVECRLVSRLFHSIKAAVRTAQDRALAIFKQHIHRLCFFVFAWMMDDEPRLLRSRIAYFRLRICGRGHPQSGISSPQLVAGRV